METSLYPINILCWCYSWYIRIWMGFWSLWQIYQFHCFQLYCSGFWNCHTICIFIRVISYCSICDGIILYDLFLVTFHVKWVLGTYLLSYILTEKPFFNNNKIKIILLFKLLEKYYKYTSLVARKLATRGNHNLPDSSIRTTIQKFNLHYHFRLISKRYSNLKIWIFKLHYH